MTFQGIEFTPGMRKLVVKVKQFFSLNKKNHEEISQKSPFSLTAMAMGISESTVRAIIAAYNKGGEENLSWSYTENRGRPPYYLEPGLESVVRQFVRTANKSGNQVTLDVINKFISANYNSDVALNTLWRALVRWGFEFGNGKRSAHLKESDRIIILRRQYLRAKLANRRKDGSAIRPEVYLNESYINKNHSRDCSWFGSNENYILTKPAGKGDRLIIVNAINCHGWIPNSKYVFKSAKKTTDYHASMNWNVFREWFETKLLPNIHSNSIIIMDNAPYHNVFTDEAFPQQKTTMFQLRYWLSVNNIPWTEDMLKQELFELCVRFANKPEFHLDKIAKKFGHTILRTPPYHPELQPIETCWAVVKSYVAKHNNFKMEKMQELLEEGFNKVTEHTIEGILKKVRIIEDTYWNEDSKHVDEKLNQELTDLNPEETEFFDECD